MSLSCSYGPIESRSSLTTMCCWYSGIILVVVDSSILIELRIQARLSEFSVCWNFIELCVPPLSSTFQITMFLALCALYDIGLGGSISSSLMFWRSSCEPVIILFLSVLFSWFVYTWGSIQRCSNSSLLMVSFSSSTSWSLYLLLMLFYPCTIFCELKSGYDD